MNRKKCLVCNQPMAKWLYGLPDYHTLKNKIDNKEVVLGGCVISFNDPIWACTSCCINYYPNGLGILSEDLISNFEENIHDYISTNILDNKEQTYNLPEKINALLKDDFLELKGRTKRTKGFHYNSGGYSSSSEDIRYKDGILIRNNFTCQIDEYDFFYSSKNIVPQEVYILSKDLKKEIELFITTSKWRKRYVNLEVLDGTQWSMKRLFENKIHQSEGSNEYPDVYETFFKMIELIIDPDRIIYDFKFQL